jgi:hypothetical protein
VEAAEAHNRVRLAAETARKARAGLDQVVEARAARRHSCIRPRETGPEFDEHAPGLRVMKAPAQDRREPIDEGGARRALEDPHRVELNDEPQAASKRPPDGKISVSEPFSSFIEIPRFAKQPEAELDAERVFLEGIRRGSWISDSCQA